jgi:hypothetical protein
MPITGQGWELLLRRRAEQRRPGSGRVRTIGDYEVFCDGAPIGLAGAMCECPGPGNNDRPGSARRIAPGTYPLATQFGRFVSVGYATAALPEGEPMPAFLLLGTAPRDDILVHPVYPAPDKPDNLYLSSTGCLNPAGDLAADEDNDFYDSRARVIALLESLRRFAPAPFGAPHVGIITPIPGARIVIEGEPPPAP